MQDNQKLLQKNCTQNADMSSYKFRPKVLCIIKVREDKVLTRFIKLIHSFNGKVIDIDEENRRIVFHANISDFINILSILKDYVLTATIQVTIAQRCMLKKKSEVYKFIKSRTSSVLVTRKSMYGILLSDNFKVLVEVTYKDNSGIIRLSILREEVKVSQITYPIPNSMLLHDVFRLSASNLVNMNNTLIQLMRELGSEICRQ